MRNNDAQFGACKAPEANPPSSAAAKSEAVRRSATAPRSNAIGWCMPPTLLAATACGVIFVLRGPDRIFGAALALLFGLALLWMLLSIFLPARGQRTCPECGRETLRRLDSDTTRGIVCSACGHADSEQSSFLLAEEETMIEPIVLRERRAVERARAVKP